MHTILRYYYTNINRRREQQQQNKKKLGEKLEKEKGLDWKVRPFPDVLWCEVEEATPLFMYLTYMYILMDARGTLVCLSLFCGCVCVCWGPQARGRFESFIVPSIHTHTGDGSHAHRDRPLVASAPSAAMADSQSFSSIFLFSLLYIFVFFFLFCF